MTTIHFTSDLHLGHEKIAALRGFSSVGEHDEAILRAWEHRVAPSDVVWVLGDLSGDRTVDRERAIDLVEGLPGEKRLVLGNHDAAHPLKGRKAALRLDTYLRAFSWAGTCATQSIGGREVLLSHFPYRRDRGRPRHLQWRLPDLGAWLIHGHTHGPERLTYQEREVHVGVDAWDLRPVRVDEVAEAIEEGERLRHTPGDLLVHLDPFWAEEHP